MKTMKTIKKAIALSLGLVMMGTASFAQSLADAKKAADAEQYQKASSMLKTLVSSQATKGENYFYLGEVYLKTEDVDSAKAVFSKGIAADAKYALNYVGLGHAELKANNASAAKANFDKAISMGTKDYNTYLYIGKAYLDQAKPDFESALPQLQKADELDSKDKEPEIFVALGDYWALQKKNTEAYQRYLAALDLNPALYRASVQIGRMFKEAQGFTEAESALKKVTAADPNYGPAYRELAELDMQWSFFDPKNGEAKRTEALANYKKYLDLTDKSFDSRYRYVQFLMYAEDWPTLGTELASLKVDQNNPKSFIITRLQGYSAIQGKNFDQGIKYMNDLFARKADASRIMGSDYLYLGKAYQGLGNDSLAVINLTKGVELDTTKVEELAAVGQKLYAAKKYDQAAAVYRKVISLNKKNPAMAMNNYYLGTSNYFAYSAALKTNPNTDKKILVEADSAYSRVLVQAPEYETAYQYKARIARVMDQTPPTGLAVPFYEKYIQLVTSKPEKMSSPAGIRGLVEAYNWLGAFYAATDKEKAKEFFNKTLAIDPANAMASDNLKFLTAPAAPVKKAPIKK
jgi:tetratricopeptide (TPR) repeat protein